jgi:hypothetical protein
MIMKNIKVMAVTSDVRTMYKRAKTSAQRALLGYMVKTGEVANPILGGAFNVLRSIEWCMDGGEIYNLYPIEDSATVSKIIDVVQSALDGDFNSFSFSAREIDNIVRCMENF